MKKDFSIALASFLMISVIFLGYTNATNGCWLNLPPTPVTMVVHDGTISYFHTVLSDVPPSYDITNGEYLGWCIDQRYAIPRDTTLEVMLYSSCDPPTDLTDEAWDMVNYILNHKQGNMMDIQLAIWYFINLADVDHTLTPEAQAMVDDASVHGAGFVPGTGEVIAVICYPEEETQITIIELRIPLKTELVVGRKLMPVGMVTVWENDGYLYIRYSTTGCWYLVETHLAVATSLGGIPQTNKGNPIPGKFPYAETHESDTTEYTYAISKGMWSAGTTLYIAAHAVVYNDCWDYCETAWGEGPTSADFPGRNWALYFTYTLCDP